MNITIEHGEIEISANLYPPIASPPEATTHLNGEQSFSTMSSHTFSHTSPPPPQVLQKTPEVLYSLGGEADMEDSAEYGELSTKD